MESMGYGRKDVEEALLENKYNDVMATYLLLSRKVTEVWIMQHIFDISYLAGWFGYRLQHLSPHINVLILSLNILFQ